MSHILHFYHLVALDYVDVNVPALIPKGHTCPNYNNLYYARGIDPINQTGGLPFPAYTVNNLGNPLGTGGPNSGAAYGDLTPYLAGQYVRALKFKRMGQQVGALFTGKMPHASMYTPGCVTTRGYDSAWNGPDAAVVQKFQELMYGGPGWDSDPGNTQFHPIDGSVITPDNAHPESILGFIGKPLDFWMWAAAGTPYNPNHLPLWAAIGVPTAGGNWKKNTGTMLFDVVFGGTASHGDDRYITRGRVHVDRLGTGSPHPGPFPAILSHAALYDHTNVNHKKVVEKLDYSYYIEPGGAGFERHPWKGKTKPVADPGAEATKYTFGKTPRYKNHAVNAVGGWEDTQHPVSTSLPYEVGPLARMMSNFLPIAGLPVGTILGAVQAGARMAYFPGVLDVVDSNISTTLGMPLVEALGVGTGIAVMPDYGDDAVGHLTVLQTVIPGSPALYGNLNLPGVAAYPYRYCGDGVLDRIGARALEAYYVARGMIDWFNALDGSATNVNKSFKWSNKKWRKVPEYRKGYGMTEAPRGALGHWVKVGDKPNQLKPGKVTNYQVITPTAWNVSPIDNLGQHGPIEESIINTPVLNDAEPLEILRVIHSFDPCIACTVHTIDAKGKKLGKAHIPAL
jgi:Ni,Fe-hydrogenase I large subunit